MGKLALELLDDAQDLSVFAALDSRSELNAAIGADAIFDVTRLDVSEGVVAFAQANSIPVVVGTSGWSAGKLATLDAKGSAVVVIPNFSVGSMLATRFAAEAAKFFDSIEIVEAHHAGHTPLVPGVGQEARGQVVAGVTVHSLRLEGISAKQSVLLSGESELLTISHETSSVAAYSAGILASIRFALNTTGVHVGLESVLAK
jgi:4-hydroxy-tetrahydrodipicolinate reductase